MPIAVLCAGRLREKYWQDAAAEYQKRMTRYNKLEIIEVPDQPEGPQAMKKEGEAMLAHLRPEDYVVALCIYAKELDSLALAAFSGSGRCSPAGWCSSSAAPWACTRTCCGGPTKSFPCPP